MQGLALIGAVVALACGAAVFLRGGPLAGCLVFLLTATCFSADFFVLDAGAAKLTVDRILWAVVMFQYLVWRRRGWDDPKPVRAPDVVVLLLVGYVAMRTFTADWHINNSAPAMHLILWYIMPLGIYWVVRQSRLSQRASLVILACLAAMGLYLAVTVIAEHFQVNWLVYPQYIVVAPYDKKAEFVGRGRGPLLNPSATGILLTACWVAALMTWARWKRAGRAMLLPLSLMFAVAVYCTMTRCVWMGAGLSLAIVAGAVMPRNWRLPVLGGALLATVLAAATHWENFVAFKRDRGLTAKETADSVMLRPVLALVAWQMFQDSPWFGCGFDQYLSEHKYYLADRSTTLVLEKGRGFAPHNTFLAMLTETGLVGLGLLVLLFMLWARDGWRLWRATAAPLWARQQGLLLLATMAAYLVNAMFQHVALIPMSNILLFFTAGVTAGLQSWVERPQPQRAGSS